MTNPTIQTDLAEVLREIKDDQKQILEKVNHLELSQARLEKKLNSQEKISNELKGSQNKQIWALIVLAFTAVVSLLVGLGKFIFFPNP